MYVPSYTQQIFSVQAATTKGACVELRPNSAQLVSSDGTKFHIEKKGRLYFLNSTVSSKRASHSLKECHEILGHCNVKDVLKLEDVVEGMKITGISGKQNFECGVCTKGKMAQCHKREANRRGLSALELVHCDLAGSIDPVAKDSFRYALGFVDDFSGLIMTYFLKDIRDTVCATERFLADVAPVSTITGRSDNGGEFTSEVFEKLLSSLTHRIKMVL